MTFPPAAPFPGSSRGPARDDLGARDDSGARDDLGDLVPVPAVVRRVVSLVPSLTESVAASAPELLVGATDWCSHPPGLAVRRVRGTKNPDLAAIGALAPDLVCANAEENRAEDLAALRAAGLAVWVTAPTTVPAALRSLDRMLRLGCGLARPDWLDAAEQVWAEPFRGPRRRAIIPIWRRPWMAVGRDTFTGDVLARLGVDNALAGSEQRYPRVDIAALPPHDLVVLPDEPYAFSPSDGPESFEARAVCVSGRLLTWYGPSLVQARADLANALGFQ
ncbi:helical backbone metal receptor [Parafrankia sp. EUN1f]|uniref:helical backbone metal receptor n=1 Tax=Parafrankia sp. EUN1f TaxID=102897 RepID=UPI0001C43F5E|nr:helical backbone metal receptor [Parafrankia sp. EUN1f]EFC82543.1 putative periplasmic substrate-binding protein [Parafrankia sp. EUN1f]